MTSLAITTLQQTTARLHEELPGMEPLSLTQAHYWLKVYRMEHPPKYIDPENINSFEPDVALGYKDLWEWEAHYSCERWESVEARTTLLEPDLDGSPPERSWLPYGFPEGANVIREAQYRGWEPELGSDEVVEFLAAVAVAETEAVDRYSLDYRIRSHILLAVMYAVFDEDQAQCVESLKDKIVAAGRIEESKAERWIQEVSKVMVPYATQQREDWSAAIENRSKLLRQILVENGQLFGRWIHFEGSTEFNFELKSILCVTR